MTSATSIDRRSWPFRKRDLSAETKSNSTHLIPKKVHLVQVLQAYRILFSVTVEWYYKNNRKEDSFRYMLKTIRHGRSIPLLLNRGLSNVLHTVVLPENGLTSMSYHVNLSQLPKHCQHKYDSKLQINEMDIDCAYRLDYNNNLEDVHCAMYIVRCTSRHRLLMACV